MPARTGLQQVRDILLSIMALLISVVCAVVLYLAVATSRALSDMGTPSPLPLPVIFEPGEPGTEGEPPR